MLSVDGRTQEPWGDASPWADEDRLRVGRPADWVDRAVTALTVAACAIGAIGALRLAEPRERIRVVETLER